MCMWNLAWKGPQNDLYCVGWDMKPYSLIHYSQILAVFLFFVMDCVIIVIIIFVCSCLLYFALLFSYSVT